MKSMLSILMSMMVLSSGAAEVVLDEGTIAENSSVGLAGVEYKVLYDGATGLITFKGRGSTTAANCNVIFHGVDILDDAGKGVLGYNGNCGHTPGPSDVLMTDVGGGWLGFSIQAADYSPSLGMFLTVVLRQDDARNLERFFGVNSMMVPNDWAGFDGSWTNRIKIVLPKVLSITPSDQKVGIDDETEFQVETDPAGQYNMVSTSVSGATVVTPYDPSTGRIKVKFNSVSTSPTDKKTVTATYGASSVIAYTVVFKIVSVTVDKGNVAVGAYASSVHQAKVTIQLTPADTFDKIRVKLSNGGGYQGGVQTDPSYPGYEYGTDLAKPAKLEIDDNGTLTGVTSGSSEEMVTCDSSGQRKGVLTSSNLVNDYANITVTVGSSTASKTVNFGRCTYALEVPDYLGSSFDITMTVTFGSSSVDGHKIKVYPKDITEYVKEKDASGNYTGNWTTQSVPLTDFPTKVPQLLTGSWPQEPVTDTTGKAKVTTGRKPKCSPADINFQGVDHTALE